MLVAAFPAGWIINGWRWNNTALKLAAAQSKARIDAEQKSRSQELALQAAADVATSTKAGGVAKKLDYLDVVHVFNRRQQFKRTFC